MKAVTLAFPKRHPSPLNINLDLVWRSKTLATTFPARVCRAVALMLLPSRLQATKPF